MRTKFNFRLVIFNLMVLWQLQLADLNFCFSQSSSFLWAKLIGCPGEDEKFTRIKCDTYNNIVVAGNFMGNTLHIDNEVINNSNPGIIHTYIAKFNQNGNLLWKKKENGILDNITIDKNNNIIITGRFLDQTITFGNFTLNYDNGNNYVVKYDSLGNVIWAINFGNGSSQVNDITTDENNNVIVTGNFNLSNFNIGNATLINAGQADIFVAKFDSNGNFLWAKSVGSSGDEFSVSIASDVVNNIIIVGHMRGNSLNFDNITLTNNGGIDAIVAKYDSQGNVLWAKNVGGQNFDYMTDVVTDSQENILVTGYFESTSISFNNIVLNNNNPTEAKGDIFLVKYDKNGNVVWAKKAGGKKYDKGISITVDGNNNVIITGSYTSSTGDPNDTIYFDNIYIIENDLDNEKSYFYATKYSENGECLWVTTNTYDMAEAICSAEGMSISVDNYNQIYISGNFISTYIYFGDTLLNGFNGGGDIFFVKINSLGTKMLKTDITCAGFNNGTATVIPVGGTTPYTYIWNTNPPQYTQTATNLAPGTYSVTVTDANGITTMDTVTIFEPSPIVIAESISHASCYNNDGSITVNVSGGVPPYSLLWSNGNTSNVINNVASGTYIITITDGNNCTIIQSYEINNSIPMPATAICLVSVDSTSTKNYIIWEKQENAPIKNYIIYRKISSVFFPVAEVNYSAFSTYVDTTYGINPYITSYQYKISIKDTCKNESPLSDAHTTIHLSISPAYPCGFNLFWNDYEGFTVTQYYIYRFKPATGWLKVDSVSYGTTSWTDPNCYTLSDSVAYLVETIKPDGCNPSKAQNPKNSTRSNIQRIYSYVPTLNNGSINVYIYPNITNGKFYIFIDNNNLPIPDNCVITIMNAQSNIIKTLRTNKHSFNFDISDLSNGVYFIRIIIGDKIFNKKIVKI